MLNSVDSESVFTVYMTGSYYLEKKAFPNDLYPTECQGHNCGNNYFCVNSEHCSMWTSENLATTPVIGNITANILQDPPTTGVPGVPGSENLTTTPVTENITANIVQDQTNTSVPVKINCGIPSDPTAITVYNSTTFGSTAVYKCKRPPQTGRSEETLQCQMSGLWSHHTISCPSTCISPPYIRAEQDVSFIPDAGFIRVHYFCKSFPDASPKVTCPVTVCNGLPDTWTKLPPPSLSCSAKDCYVPKNYSGKVSCTVTGRTCQVWKAIWPHIPLILPPVRADRSTNYCRAIGDEIRPWCYTTSFWVRWEYCPVHEC